MIARQRGVARTVGNATRRCPAAVGRGNRGVDWCGRFWMRGGAPRRGRCIDRGDRRARVFAREHPPAHAGISPLWPGGAVRLCRAVGKCGEGYSGVTGGAGLQREMQGGAGAVRARGAGVATDGGPRRASAWGQPRYCLYHKVPSGQPHLIRLTNLRGGCVLVSFCKNQKGGAYPLCSDHAAGVLVGVRFFPWKTNLRNVEIFSIRDDAVFERCEEAPYFLWIAIDRTQV